ncbi:MAG: ABC transporter permease [Vicinamibacterales bacterium]
MGQLRDDVRVALRRFRHQPGFTLVVVVTLALGLGANTAIFALVDALVLRSLPVERPQELYRLGDTNNCCVNSGLQGSFSLYSSPLFEHLRSSAPEFSELAGFQAGSLSLGVRRAGAAVPEPFSGKFVTANYFRMFGVKAAAGRLLQPDDDRPGAAPVAVLSYRAWIRFGLDPSMIGGAVVINGTPMTVAGVAQPEFFGDTIQPDPPGVWIPISQEPLMRAEASLVDKADQYWLYAIGRLAPGTNRAQVGSRVTTALQQWLSSQPFISEEARAEIPRQHIVVTPAGGGVPLMQAQFSRSLTLLFATSAVLLLIASANLANLLLARADRGQAAIRAALGASASRLVRQSLTEGVLLALVGGALGVAVASLGTRALIALAFPGAAFVPVSTTPSGPVLFFSTALAIVTGMLFTGAPAWAMSRTAPLDALAGIGRGGQGKSFVPRRSLVIAQVALSFVMLTSAGLLASSLGNLERQPLGFDPGNRFVLRIDVPPTATPEGLLLVYGRLQAHLAAVSGVKQVSYALSSPMDGNNWQSRMAMAGRTTDPSRPGTSWNRVGPKYFDTVGTRVLRGRAIEERDVPGARRVAVINQAFAKAFFETADPIGQTVGIGGPAHGGDFEIVGVVDDVKHTTANQPVRAMLYLPGFQVGAYADASDRNVQARSMLMRAIVVHAAPGAVNLERSLREAVAAVDPNINVTRVMALEEQLSGNFRIERLMARLTSIYGVLALVLASLGLYGVTSYAVAQRTREIGVRMALGAGRARIMRTVVGGPLLETAAGLAIGIPMALLAGNAISAQLYGVGGQNPAVIGLAIGVLVVTAGLAAAIPARRAASVDPARALRGQ